jgi:hypothetical protein
MHKKSWHQKKQVHNTTLQKQQLCVNKSDLCVCVVMTSTWVFSYGSNSSTQLRARVKNPSLTCVPASVEDHSRVFCLSSKSWSVGEVPSGAASLVPDEGACTHGCAALMSDAELVKLDVFEGAMISAPHEGVYRRAPVKMKVQQQSSGSNKEDYQEVEGIMYIANDMRWQYPPSEQYLTAIHVMLRDQRGSDFDSSITVRGVLACDSHIEHNCISDEDNNMPVAEDLYSWSHPGTHSLSLAAVCVEVNVLRESPWVMPATIKVLSAKFASVGIHSSAQLAVHLVTREMRDALNEHLENAGERRIKDSTLLLFKQVIGV